MRLANVILAAGFGTRMKSDLPKVLHPLMGRPMVEWSVAMAERVSGRTPVVVVGHGREQVQATLGDRAVYAVQEQLLGTGHAVQQARACVDPYAELVLVTYADMPLLRAETLLALVDAYGQAVAAGESPALSMLTVQREDPQGFGRIVRDAQGAIQAIVEEADCSAAQRRITELNPGVYCFNAAWLWENLDKVPLSAKGEYYLTDMVGIAVAQGLPVVTLEAPAAEVDGINNRVQLAHAGAVLRSRILEAHMLDGVTIIDPATTFIEDGVTIGADTTIWPGTYLQGATQIGRNAVIGPNSQIVDSVIGDGCRVSYAVVEEARMEAHSEIGPYGHLRKGAHLAEGVHMGNFGEVKNSYLGPGVKMGHFSYIGDAQVGENANIGAGTITCNFDGKQKNRTVIGDNAFIGSDTLLIAPVVVGVDARTGAGAVVTRNVAPGELVVGVPARPVPVVAQRDDAAD